MTLIAYCSKTITSHTARLIDNVFTNYDVKSINDLLLAVISDHLPIFSTCFMDSSCNDDRLYVYT